MAFLQGVFSPYLLVVVGNCPNDVYLLHPNLRRK